LGKTASIIPRIATVIGNHVVCVQKDEPIVNALLLHVGQDEVVPGKSLILVHLSCVGEDAVGVVVVVRGDNNLMKIVLTTHAVGRLAHLLDRGQKQANQDGNDGNDDQ